MQKEVKYNFKALFGYLLQASWRAKKNNISKLALGENICRQCSLCCYDKTIMKDGAVHYLDTHCKYLSRDGQCCVYEQKASINPFCLCAQQALMNCTLPKECGYVQANWELIKDWYILPKS